MLHAGQNTTLTIFVAVSSVGIKRVVCTTVSDVTSYTDCLQAETDNWPLITICSVCPCVTPEHKCRGRDIK